jgi:SAM-dependent methyltransferase
MTSEKPARIEWAVEVLSIQPEENILEIGCGHGHAVDLICKQLSTGKIVGIDRSAKAIRAAEANNQGCISAGKAELLNIDIASLKLQDIFDKIFAINVNIFWTGPKGEIAKLSTLMNGNSRLYLFYEPPSLSQLDKVLTNATWHLRNEKLEILDVLRNRLTSNEDVCIIARKGNA